MSRISLQPAAAPVDTFAAPEVRAKSSSADRLAGLARSLSGFNQNLTQVGGQILDEKRKEALVQASKDQAVRRFENMQAFKSAVEAGEIKAADNPYYQTYMHQLIARDSVRKTFQTLDQEVESNKELRFGSLEAVQSHIDNALAPALEGQPTWVLEAILPEVTAYRDNALGRHADRRRKDTEITTKVGFSRELSGAINQAAPALKAGVFGDGEADGLVKQIQPQIDMALQSAVPDYEVQDWVANTIAQAGSAFKSYELVEKTLSKLTVNGRPVSELIPAGSLETIKERIEDDIARDESRALSRASREDSEIKDQLFASLYKISRDAIGSGQLLDINSKIPFDSLPPSVQTQAAQLAEALNSDIEKSFVNKQTTEYISSRLSQPYDEKRSLSLYAVLTMASNYGPQAIENIKQFELKEQENSWGTTVPEVQGNLYRMLADPSKSAEDVISAVMNATNSRVLGRVDASYLLNASVQKSKGITTETQRLLSGDLDLFNGVLSSSLLRDSSAIDAGLVTETVEGTRELTALGRSALGNQLTQVNQLFWEASKAGKSEDEALMIVRKEIEKRTQTAKSVPQAPTVQNAEISQGLSKDPAAVRSSIVNKGGELKFISKEGTEVPVGASRIFANPDDLRQNFAKFAMSAGIDNDDQYIKLAHQQAKLIGDPAAGLEIMGRRYYGEKYPKVARKITESLQQYKDLNAQIAVFEELALQARENRSSTVTRSRYGTIETYPAPTMGFIDSYKERLKLLKQAQDLYYTGKEAEADALMKDMADAARQMREAFLLTVNPSTPSPDQNPFGGPDNVSLRP